MGEETFSNLYCSPVLVGVTGAGVEVGGFIEHEISKRPIAPTCKHPTQLRNFMAVSSTRKRPIGLQGCVASSHQLWNQSRSFQGRLVSALLPPRKASCQANSSFVPGATHSGESL